MPEPGIRRVLLAIAAALLFPTPGAVADEGVDARVERLRGHLQSCTQRYGYDPDRVRSLGPHEIGPGELKWRDCAYRGIREIMVSASAVPETYDTLIGLDRVMTRDIEAGKRTRDERRQRIQQLIDDILAREKKAGEPPEAELTEEEMERRRDEFVLRQRELQRMRRIESMMR
jgi:hypothetical protein